jgi:hypothetical protein
MRKMFLFVVVVWLTACSTIDCPVENTVSVQYEIRDKAGKELAITDSLSIVSTRQDGDYVVLNRLSDKSSFSIPISYAYPEDVLYFCFKNLDNDSIVVDTVCIEKDDFPHFESVDCNASFFHEITNVQYTRHYIDSLVLLNKSVTYDQTTVHFRLVPKDSN